MPFIAIAVAGSIAATSIAASAITLATITTGLLLSASTGGIAYANQGNK